MKADKLAQIIQLKQYTTISVTVDIIALTNTGIKYSKFIYPLLIIKIALYAEYTNKIDGITYCMPHPRVFE